jgi:hypothetical protein
MRGRFRIGALAALAVGGLAVGIPVAGSAHSNDGGDGQGAAIKHVLLISVDGLHQSDLEWYVAHHPGSELARLTGGGAEYAKALTPFPSDSSPGMVAQATGGDPGVTGIYYDSTYNHNVLPAGTTTCTPGQPLGAPVFYAENLDKDPLSIDAGQGLAGLPGSILQMTGQPQTLFNTAAMPVDPKTCKPIYPNQYLKVNTIFEVAHEHGMRTAWSDKHPAYAMLDGHSGTGIDDLFAPEVNSQAIGYPAGNDWTKDNAATMQYDSYKVQAVINEIDGYDHSRSTKVGVPAIFGMNFQTVSTAQKLPTSDGLTGGYLPGTRTPGPLVARSFEYINAQLEAMAAELRAQGLSGSTAIIVSAKHGQAPVDPNQLTRVPDGPIIAAVDAGWASTHPGAAPLVAQSTDDTGILWWLSDRSPAALEYATHYLLSNSAIGNTINGSPRTVTASGLTKVYAGPAAAAFFHVALDEPRHPDLVGIAQQGVLYTGGMAKIADHGGASLDDRNVPLVVYAPGVVTPNVVSSPVETTQIAPTILSLLGLDPNALQAVQIEGTQVLPGS